MIRGKTGFSGVIFGLILAGITGCFEPPDIPIEPKIAFENLIFKRVTTGADSLTLRFNLEDGNGDIGLSSNETLPPYHAFNAIIDERDSLVLIGDTTVVPPLRQVDPFSNVTPFSETDNRPPYNCTDYFVYLEDTFYINKNEYHNNLHITFLLKDLVSGEFTEIDFASYFGNACSSITLDGRIPVFDSDLIGDPLQGIFSYYMVSEGFLLVLSNQTFKIRFYIYDRALNQSNIVETPEVTLLEISE